MHPSVRASAATTLRTALALGVMVGGPLLFGVAAHATPTAYYVTDPVQCPSEHDQFPGQKCSGGLDICGYVTTTTGDVAQCYDTSTMADPSSPATSNTQYSGVLGGGFVLNCFAAADGAAPFCDNGGAWLCNRASACYTTKQRDTVCAAPAGDVSAYSCGSCRTGYQDCAGDDACEVQTGVTNYPTGANNNYAASCTAQCDTGYLDCDASGAGSGNGCEIQDGAACTVGNISGTYDGCTCVPHKNYFETGTNTSYGTADPLLWGTQYGTGKLVSFNDDTRERFAVFNDGLLFAEGGLSTSGALTWEGAASGSSIWVSTFDGAGLADCDLATDKIVWDATTKRFACATDLSVGTGLDIATGDDRYVNVSGDTMTGALIIDVRGTDLGVGLEVIEAISGSTIFANRGLSTSGSLVWEGAASGATLYVASSVRGSGLTDCDVSTQKLQWDAATGRFSCGTDQNAGLGTNVFSGSVLTILRNYTGSLLFLRTVSGTTIHANTTVTSSGSITWETFASGSSIWVSTFSGAGLTDCDLSTQKLLYDAQTEKFVCSTDQIGGFGTNVFSGAILRLIQNFTGSMLHVNTISGAIIHANTTLSSSGGIVWEGTASGASLWVSTFSGAGLTDCDLSTQKLLYDATTERFTCGTDQNSGGAGTNVFSGSVLTLIRNYSGSLLRLQTISGTTLHANTSITTSGSITWETIASGSSIWVSTFSGAGLTDCDLSTQKLLYDAQAERFTCGTDQEGAGSVTAGQGLSKNGSVLSLNSSITGSFLQFDTVSGSALYAANQLSVSGFSLLNGNVGIGVGSMATKATLSVTGTVSGATVYATRSFSGAGLTDCDADNQTLSWDASTGRFGCGDDDSSGANFTAGQGLALNGSVLVLNSSISGSLLEFQTVSGAMVYAERQLSVSGSVTLGEDNGDNLVFNGDVASNFQPDATLTYLLGNSSARWSQGWFGSINASADISVLGNSSLTGNVGIGSANTTTKAVLGVSGTISGTTVYATRSFSGAGLSDCDAAGSKLAWDATTGRFSCGTDQTGASSLTAGQGLALNGTVLTLNGTLTGSLLKFTTVSGSLLYANRTLASSGTLVWEGAGSGSSLYAGTLGVGIGSVDSGLKLEIAGTASGRVLYAQQSLRSSGSLVWEGAASGATLYVGGAIRGSGLSTDCDASSSKLLWDTTTGRFSCGSDLSSTNTAGQGLSLASSTFRLNSTFSGTLLTSYGVTFSSGGALSRLTGYQGYINFPTYGLAIAGTPLITNQGNLTNIHSIRAGEMHLVRGGKFLSKTDYFAATSTPSVFGMTTGDFNGDGYPDMAQAIFNAITVFINNGDGTFATKVDYASTSAGTTSLHMASADVNGDGKLDLISSDYGASTISVFLNRGNGTFLAGVAYSTQSNPSGITTNDFNADGKVDVAVSNYGSNSVSVLLNNSNGTFATQAAYTVTPGTPYGISSADFNGDGEIDLITAQNYGTSYSILLNKGDGTFAASVDTAVTGVMEEIAAGDFNGDGKADIAYNKPTTNVVGVVLNNGNMSFASEVTYGTGLKPSMVIAKDVNADGWLDLVASNYDADTVSVLLNNGNGTFATKVDYTTRDAPRMIAADDFNGDGALDLAAVDYGDGYVSVLMNDTRTALHTVGSGAIGIGTYTPGSILSISGSALINPTGSIGSTKADAGLALEIIGTASGRTLFAMNALRSSGALVWEGAGSGTSLYAGTLGVGIGSVDSGLKLEIAGTASGRVLYAQQAIRSSGSVVLEGTLSGANVFGFGLATDCDAALTSKLLWDATTGRFSCGTDQTGGSSLTAGRGLALNGTVLTLNTTITGSLLKFTTATGNLLRFNTVSGSLLFANRTLASSGSFMMARSTLSTAGTLGSVTPFSIYPSGKYLYATDQNNGTLSVIDISSSTPVSVGSVSIAGSNGYDIHVAGSYAYVADGTSGMEIYDVSRPSTPTLVSTLATTNAQGVFVAGQYAYVADSTAGLRVVDISNPASPRIVGTSSTSSVAKMVWVSGRHAYVADGTTGLRIVDVSIPSAPFTVGSVSTGGSSAISVQVVGRYAYVGASSTFYVIDVKNPASPSVVGSIAVGTNAQSIDVNGRYAYVADNISGVRVIDVTTPASPTIVSTFASGQAFDVKAIGRYLYVAVSTGLRAVDIGTIDAPSATIGSLEAYGLSVLQSATFDSNVTVGKALNIGAGMYVYGMSAMRAYSGAALLVSTQDKNNAPALVVQGAMSGTIVYAQQTLRSSGSLVWEGAGSGSSLYAGTLGIGIGSVDSGLKLEIAGTASGRVLYAQQAIRSSGSLVWEGAASGSTIYIGGSLQGVGLSDCDTASTSKLLWDATTGRFSCGSDQNTAGSYKAGQGLALSAASSFSLNTTITGSLVRFTTISGSTVFAKNGISTSGSLIMGRSTPKVVNLYTAGSTLNSPENIAVVGRYAYIASLSSLKIADVTDPSSPSLVSATTIASIYNIEVVGRLAYVVSQANGLGIYDVSNPSSPFRVGGYDTAGTAKGIRVVGKHAYVADGLSGFEIFDVSDPANPVLVSATDTAGNAVDVAVSGDYAYVSDVGGGLAIYNVLDPAAPRLVSTYNTSITPYDTVVLGKYAYVFGAPDLTILNVSNPASPTLVSSVSGGGSGIAFNGAVAGRYAYAADVNDGFVVIDVSTPSSPVVTAIQSDQSGVYDVDVVGRYAYVADNAAMWVLDVSGVDAPAANIGSLEANYLSVRDAARFNANVLMDRALNVGGGLSVLGSSNMYSLSGAALTLSSSGSRVPALLNVRGLGSGAVLFAANSLRSSGSLVWEGAGSGSSLYAGTLGIGIGSVDSGLKLEIAGTASGRVLYAQQSLRSSGSLVWEGAGSGSSLYVSALGVRTVSNDAAFEVLGTASGGTLFGQFMVRSSGSVIVENNLFVDSGTLLVNGTTDKVGIGTATPGAKLHIFSTVNGNSNLFIDTPGTQGNQTAMLTLISKGDGASDMGSANTKGWMINARGDAWTYTNQQNDLEFDYWDGSQYRRSMHIDSVTGYVALGPQAMDTFTPDSTIEVLGTASGFTVFATNSLSTSGALVWEQTATGSALFAGGGTFNVTRSGSVVINTENAGATANVFQIITDVAGNEDRAFRIRADGTVFSDNAYNSTGADYAEWFFTSTSGVAPGEVVCIDPTKLNTVKRCDRDGDDNVMGIVSTKPAFVGNVLSGADGLPVPNTVLVGLIGQVPAKVLATGGSGSAIRPGDSLTAASRPGYARKARPGESTVGVALEGLPSGEGVVNVLISRRNQSLTVSAVEDEVIKQIQAMEIDDEVEMMVAEAMGDLNVDQSIIDEVGRQVDALNVRGAVADEVARQLDEALGQRVSTGSATSSGALTGDMRASTLWLASTLAVDGDARIAGDLHLDGALVTNDLFVPGVMAVDGSLTSSSLTVTGDSDIHGTLTLHGPLVLGSGSSLQFGTGLTLADLVVQRSLAVLGDVTIDGFTRFLGDVAVEGELVVARQAGHLLVPAGATGATFAFEPAFAGQPVVTASPNVPVLYAVSIATSSGFTVSLAAPADRAVTFSWVALIVPSSAPSGSGSGLPFPVDDTGTPVSSSLQWNACIRNVPLFDPSGVPYSCSRYHDGTLWYHPDSNLSFVWNDAVTPPYMELPEGYVSTVTETSASVRAAINTVNAEQAPSAPAAPTDEAPADEPAPSDVPPEQPEPTVDEGSAPAVDAPAEPAEEAPVEQPAPEPAPTEPAQAESAVVE